MVLEWRAFWIATEPDLAALALAVRSVDDTVKPFYESENTLVSQQDQVGAR